MMRTQLPLHFGKHLLSKTGEDPGRWYRLRVTQLTRHSVFTDQFGDMANSTPPPAAQPNGGGYGKFHILKSSADSAVKQKPVPCDARAATRRSEPSA
jgi:hypothetical protein